MFSLSPQKRATVIASTTAFFLAVLKFSVGIFSGSIAILSSAIDSLLDMFVSLFNVFAIHNAEKNPDSKFNYGRGKTEALAAFLEGIIISFSAFYILYQSIQKLITGAQVENLGVGIVVMIVSVCVTALLVWYLTGLAKKTKNIVLESDALHYKTDLFSNLAILVALGIIYFTGFYQIDAILGMIIAVYILYEAVKIIKKGYLLLLDISLEQEEVKNIQKIITDHPKVESFHLFKSRKSGEYKFVEAHLVFGHDMLLSEAHNISHEIEDSIEELDTTVHWNVLFHLDPYDDSVSDLRIQ